MKHFAIPAIMSLLLIVFCSFFIVPQAFAAALEVDFGNPPVAPNAPVFSVSNMLPGDTEERQITVKNNTSISMNISIVGTKTNETKSYASILDVDLYKNATHYYGGTTPKKLSQFFTDSASPGLFLFTVNGNSQKDFFFKVKFPESSGNEYQLAKVEFNLLLGTTITTTPTLTPTPTPLQKHIVVNEVYYDVDKNHGFDCLKDRGIDGIQGNTLTIEDNGEGSHNKIDVDIKDICKVVQTNNADLRNAVNVYLNTGGNTANGNSGNTSITTGGINFFQQILNFLNFNLNLGSCNVKKFGQNDEWVELYNPTDSDVPLKNWTLTDNSGNATTINANVTIKARGFALISKDLSVWQNWNEPLSTPKIALGMQIGDGLDNNGDHLILKNPQIVVVDQMGWQNDAVVWNPAAIDVVKGHSLERNPDGFDTDLPSDFKDTNPPTPGT